MLRLETFGGLSLVGDGAPPPAALSQRRRLAILAMLAAAGERGVRRDRLVSLLWPDRADDRARHVLAQTVYALRPASGATGLVVGGDALRLNGQAVTIDVAEFDAALGRGDLETAVALHRAPFLDGVALPGAPEFERWASAERERLSRDFADAAAALATAAMRRGAHGMAAGLWRRLAAVDPLSATAAAGLIEALAAAGDRSAALRAAEVHVALVREELEVEPAPAVAEWLVRLRAPAPPVVPPVAPASGARTAAAASHAVASDRAVADDDATADDGVGAERARVERMVGARYAVGELRARGSVVATYVARDRRSGAAVELHVVDPRVRTLTDVRRVLAHCERVAGFATPLVAPLVDFGAAREGMFFVTQPVEGPTLRARLARERLLPVPEAVRVARDVALALAHAHERGVVHGDLRPKHVVLGAAHAQVGGFANARMLLADGGPWSSVAVTVGAPAYLSPEALTGEAPLDALGDVYAVGCVLAEMLTGEPPFGREASYAVIARKLSQQPPSLRVLRPSVSGALERAVHGCLARERVDRHPSAAALADALDRLV